MSDQGDTIIINEVTKPEHEIYEDIDELAVGMTNHGECEKTWRVVVLLVILEGLI